MLHLYFLVLSMMCSLSPAERPILRHGALATAIAVVVSEEGPLFRSDPELTRTAALLVAVSFRESSFDVRAVGDHGRSVCAFQIHGGSPELLEDPVLCARTGYRMLKESLRMDPSHPVAFYARGPRFTSPEAVRLSDDRMRVARTLAKGAW